MRGPSFLSREAVRNFGRRDSLDWRCVARIRRGWTGKLVLKGILSPADASIARDSGADGIIVSNHGGRQLDFAVSPIRVLTEIPERSGEEIDRDMALLGVSDIAEITPEHVIETSRLHRK